MATNDVWGARADQVGSLLRSDRLIAARDKANTGQMDAGELRAMEDDAIRDVVRMQEAAARCGCRAGNLARGMRAGS